MACGVATVMSGVGVNPEIISHGQNGFLALSHQEWLHCLSQLIENPVLREQMGKAGRETVVNRYSVLANRQLYLEVLNSLAKQ